MVTISLLSCSINNISHSLCFLLGGINYGHPTVQNVRCSLFGCSSNTYITQTINLQPFSFLILKSSSFFSFLFSVLPFYDYIYCPHSRQRNRMSTYSHLRKWDIQGVEFTEISCSRGELGWSECEGMASRCKGLRATVSCANEGRKFGSVCQHSIIILSTMGSTSLGMSRRRFWKPTAPTTCIGFIPLQGNLIVASSHRMTPKL